MKSKPIGEMLFLYRREHGLGVRALGQRIGISHGTVSRIERGYDCDALSLLRILNWMLGEWVSW
jgi:transcriptional regulator with XRE-family HTH domain